MYLTHQRHTGLHANATNTDMSQRSAYTCT